MRELSQQYFKKYLEKFMGIFIFINSQQVKFAFQNALGTIQEKEITNL